MFRPLAKLAVTIVASLAFLVIALGSGSDRVAHAAPTVTVAAPGAATCGVPVTVSAIVTDPVGFVSGLPVTFSSSQGTFLAPSTTTGVTGVASTSFTPSTFAGTATLTATVSGAATSAPALLNITCGTASTCNPSFPATCVNTASTCNPSFPATCVNTGCNTGFTVFGASCGTNCGTITIPGCVPQTCIPPSNFFQAGTTTAPNLQALQTTACQVSILPTNATAITVQGPASANCNQTFLVSATLRDPNGLPVPNGTIASFTSSLGTIQASATLMVPDRVSGTAQVTVSSGSTTGTASVPISCAAAPAAAAAAPAPAAVAPAAPIIAQPLPASISPVRPPSTGDAGLKAMSGDD
jgi:hypothetical protein